MQTAPAHIARTEERIPGHLALDRGIHGPRFRVLKRLALSRHDQRDGISASSPKVVHRAKGQADVRLEGGISAQEDRVAHTQAGNKAARARAHHGLVVKLICDAQPRLDVAILDIRVVVGNAAEQVLVQTRGGLRNPACGGRGKSAARNNHAIVELICRRRAGDETGRRIYRHGLAGIIKPWIEDDHVSPICVVGNNDRVTDTVVDVQLL